MSSDSPFYLDINPYDGCVKLAQSYRLTYDENKIIKYSVSIWKKFRNDADYKECFIFKVGVMNPGFPECLSSSFFDCTIVIKKIKDRAPTCESPLSISCELFFF